MNKSLVEIPRGPCAFTGRSSNPPRNSERVLQVVCPASSTSAEAEESASVRSIDSRIGSAWSCRHYWPVSRWTWSSR